MYNSYRKKTSEKTGTPSKSVSKVADRLESVLKKKGLDTPDGISGRIRWV